VRFISALAPWALLFSIEQEPDGSIRAVLHILFRSDERPRLVAASDCQHGHIVETRAAVGKRPHVVKAGGDQIGRLPRSLLTH
jgi:hypothetical protein